MKLSSTISLRPVCVIKQLNFRSCNYLCFGSAAQTSDDLSSVAMRLFGTTAFISRWVLASGRFSRVRGNTWHRVGAARRVQGNMSALKNPSQRNGWSQPGDATAPRALMRDSVWERLNEVRRSRRTEVMEARQWSGSWMVLWGETGPVTKTYYMIMIQQQQERGEVLQPKPNRLHMRWSRKTRMLQMQLGIYLTIQRLDIFTYFLNGVTCSWKIKLLELSLYQKTPTINFGVKSPFCPVNGFTSVAAGGWQRFNRSHVLQLQIWSFEASSTELIRWLKERQAWIQPDPFCTNHAVQTDGSDFSSMYVITVLKWDVHERS